MTKKNEKNEEKILNRFYKGIRENSNRIVVIICWFLVSLLIAFVQVSTSETVLAFSLDDFKLGQISDRTIIAERDLPPDVEFPVEIIKGETIVERGFPISETALSKLRKMAGTPAYIDSSAFWDAVLYLLCLIPLIFFLYSPTVLGYKQKKREQIFIASSLCLVFAFAVFIPLFFNVHNMFYFAIGIPGVFIAIMITVMFGHMIALFYSIVTFFLVLFAASYSVIPAIFEFASCLCAVYVVRRIKHRFDMVMASLVLVIINVLIQFLLTIIFGGKFLDLPLALTGVALNGFLSCILALGFITPFELLLNTASAFRLLDLSDLNTPIMRRLLLAAPGTYNHSMMVATLAESACTEIGANSLLARVGAYYHDLGKIDQPEYFVENQSGSNKHDEINPRLSVSVIRSHVRKGVEKARQLRLPEEVIDIIAEHHGNSLIAYFYSEAKKQDDQTSPEDYSYGGNPPSSKEAAVVMLADTVEAACRTLEKPSVSRLEKFIHQLVMGKYEHGQLDKANLTFRDLNAIEASFVTILAGYYHTRIEYPDQKDPDALPDKTQPSGKAISEKSDKQETKTEKSEGKGVIKLPEKADKSDKTDSKGLSKTAEIEELR